MKELYTRNIEQIIYLIEQNIKGTDLWEPARTTPYQNMLAAQAAQRNEQQKYPNNTYRVAIYKRTHK